MKTTILAVDDDDDFLDALRLVLETADYQVLTAENGKMAIEILHTHPVHLILADIAMPGMNGYQLFNRLSQHPQWVFIPFIFISARNLDSDVQYGKELGVDDYLIKPVKSEDLLAIIRGKLKRAKRWMGSAAEVTQPLFAANSADILSLGYLKISLSQHRVWRGDNLIQLSALEFRLLVCLAQQPGRVLPHQVLIQATHGLETDIQDGSRLLRPLVRSLRRKLGYPAGEKGCIESVRGVGYQFIPPPNNDI